MLQGLLEWTSSDVQKRRTPLKSFLEKINLEEIVPQVLIEVIQHPVISGDMFLESRVRSALTTVLSKKFDSVQDEEAAESSGAPLRCFHSQDVSKIIQVDIC